MKRLNFKVEAVPDTKPKVENTNRRELKNPEYKVPENVSRWIEKFGTCSDILNEAKKREKELIKELEQSDKEILDILHVIELDSSKDLYGGWLLYKKIRKNRKSRRDIKDEIFIIEDVMKEIDPSHLERKKVKKAIDGLLGRKYRFRIVEDEESDDLQNVQ